VDGWEDRCAAKPVHKTEVLRDPLHAFGDQFAYGHRPSICRVELQISAPKRKETFAASPGIGGFWVFTSEVPVMFLVGFDPVTSSIMNR
jgi:hypothetical protein